MGMPNKVRIVEVGPRDGLQAESSILPVKDRIRFINLLSETGLNSIEVGSFVSPRWIPQMEESGLVYQGINKKEGVDYSLLVPNHKGFQEALNAGVTSIAVFTAASETFCQKNINMSIEKSLQVFRSFVPQAKEKKMRVRGYISCVVDCPYEGTISPSAVYPLAIALKEMGCDEISLGDTLGRATPPQIKDLLQGMPIPKNELAVHFHDTFSQALVNIYTALEEGIQIIDSSISGLGGCPYAPGAAGNVATEDVVMLCQGLGIDTDINLDSLVKAGQFIDKILERQTTSKAALALRSKFDLS